MGKIVKFCAKCEEGFAEKFGFCPNCGENLEAFEMNPVEQAAAAAAANTETLPPVKETAAFAETETVELDSVDVPEEKSYETQSAEAASPAYFYDEEMADDDYRPTVLEEKDVQLRNGLLLSFGCLVISATMIAWVVSIFVHSLEVDAFNDKELFSFVGEIEDKPIDLEDEDIKDDEKAGGGGGGKERDRDASRGDLPNQSRTPSNYISPMEQSESTLKHVNVTEGPQTNRPLMMPTGLLNGVDGPLSSGRGKGGGIGDGDGTGVGSGIGSGNEGDGKGRGGKGGTGATGDDDGEDGPTLSKGVSSPVKIISKQQAKYTDAARTNNIQGTVTLKVTFTAAGTIGAISTVSGLPYGLTDQAIAAARAIRFEPAKKNGQAITTSRTIAFSFTIY